MDAYFRIIGLCSVPVTSHFRYKDEFQIYPVPAGSPSTSYLGGRHPFVLEVRYESVNQMEFREQGSIEPGVVNAERRIEKAEHLLLVLTALSRFDLYIPKQRSAWYWPQPEVHTVERPLPAWGTEAYILWDLGPNVEGFSIGEWPATPLIENAEYFGERGNPIDQEFEFPSGIIELLDASYAVDDSTRKAFLSACLLHSQAHDLWQHYPSLSFASAVSGIEALIDFEHKNHPVEKCGQCGQPRYRVVRKFLEFCRDYGTADRKYKVIFQAIYNMRSKVLHAGNLLPGDLVRPRFGTWDGFDERNLHRLVLQLFRACACSWISAKAAVARAAAINTATKDH